MESRKWIRLALIISGPVILLAFLGYFIQGGLFRPTKDVVISPMSTTTPPAITIIPPTSIIAHPSSSPVPTGMVYTVNASQPIQNIINKMGSFNTFDSRTGGTSVWKVIAKPSEPKPPEAGA